MSVYTKLLELQKKTRGLKKDKDGAQGQYKYVTGEKLFGQVRPIMDEVGLLLLPEILDIVNTPITYAVKSGQKTEMFTTIKARFTWVDTETGEEKVCLFAANGMNGWDKGLGSALTYAERYYVLKTLHISTDEDDVDAIVREDVVASTKPSQAPAPTPQKPAEVDAEYLAKAIKEANESDSTENLNAVWKKYRGDLKEVAEFVKAVKANKFHPSNVQNNG